FPMGRTRGSDFDGEKASRSQLAARLCNWTRRTQSLRAARARRALWIANLTLTRASAPCPRTADDSLEPCTDESKRSRRPKARTAGERLGMATPARRSRRKSWLPTLLPCRRWCGVDEHKGDATVLSTVIHPGVVRALLNQHIAGFQVHF